MKTEEEKAEYRRQYPELEEVMAIVEEIDRNNNPVKEEQTHYINAIAIKKWMEDNNTTKPPRSQNEKKTVPEDEAQLGRALSVRGETKKKFEELEKYSIYCTLSCF